MKVLLYGLFGHDVLVFIAKVFSFIPENILLYAFLPIWYIFMRPVMWVLSNLSSFNPGDNKFIAFSLDIALTIIYLTILFFLFKSIFTFFKNKTKSIKVKNYKSFAKYLIIIIIFFIVVAFFVGLNWSTITLFSKRIIPSKLMCFGFNNLQETYQLNCYAPLTENQKKYSFKDHLICKTITNHQFRTSDTKYQFEFPKIYNEITSIKNDYSNLILDFDYGNNEIKSSSQPGEPKKDPFVMIQNDNNVVNAIRKTKLDNNFGYEYQYITLSKKTGKGSLTWTNTQDYNPHLDSFATKFFQCE